MDNLKYFKKIKKCKKLIKVCELGMINKSNIVISKYKK